KTSAHALWVWVRVLVHLTVAPRRGSHASTEKALGLLGRHRVYPGCSLWSGPPKTVTSDAARRQEMQERTIFFFLFSNKKKTVPTRPCYYLFHSTP
ncbi:hypothetical protein CSUI_007778, partial [Cystoisospora suis]